MNKSIIILVAIGLIAISGNRIVRGGSASVWAFTGKGDMTSYNNGYYAAETMCYDYYKGCHEYMTSDALYNDHSQAYVAGFLKVAHHYYDPSASDDECYNQCIPKYPSFGTTTTPSNSESAYSDNGNTNTNVDNSKTSDTQIQATQNTLSNSNIKSSCVFNCVIENPQSTRSSLQQQDESNNNSDNTVIDTHGQ